MAVSAIKERAGLARLPLADMGRWGHNDGTSVTNAIKTMSEEAYRALIAGFGIAIRDAQIVELDGSGHFDLVCDLGDGAGRRPVPLFGVDRGSTPRTREAILGWAGSVGREMLRVAEAVGAGEWAGVEG